MTEEVTKRMHEHNRVDLGPHLMVPEKEITELRELRDILAGMFAEGEKYGLYIQLARDHLKRDPQEGPHVLRMREIVLPGTKVNPVCMTCLNKAMTLDGGNLEDCPECNSNLKADIFIEGTNIVIQPEKDNGPTQDERAAIGLYAVLSRDVMDFMEMIAEATQSTIKTLHGMLVLPNAKHSECTKELNALGAELVEGYLEKDKTNETD